MAVVQSDYELLKAPACLSNTGSANHLESQRHCTVAMKPRSSNIMPGFAVAFSMVAPQREQTHLAPCQVHLLCLWASQFQRCLQ